jgi:hypothetical protein
MQSLGFIIWAVVIMAILNILVVGLTLGTKALRVISKHHAKRRTERLEEALDSSLEMEEIHPDLKNLGSRDLDILSALLIQYLSVLRGSERERLVGLATEAGLREVYSQRISARGRWRKARAAENLGYFGGPPAVVLLTRLLSNPDETLRAVAARALARIGNLEAVEALARTLTTPPSLRALGWPRTWRGSAHRRSRIWWRYSKVLARRLRRTGRCKLRGSWEGYGRWRRVRR